MGAALSIVVLFTISSTIVRVMSVVLEHTGVPQSIARIQVLSALSGTGFTTTESEMLLHTPERRRILTLLMISGSVGIASISATLIVGAFGVADTGLGILKQVLFVGVALAFVRYVIFAGSVDNIVCAAANRWLHKQGFEVRGYTVLHRIGPKTLVAEHLLKPDTQIAPEDLTATDLDIVGQRTSADPDGELVPLDMASFQNNTTLVVIGTLDVQDRFSTQYGVPLPQAGH